MCVLGAGDWIVSISFSSHGHPTSSRPRPLLPLSRRGQASKISDLRRGGRTCELQGGERTAQYGAVVSAAGKPRCQGAVPRLLETRYGVRSISAGHATLTGPPAPLIGSGLEPQQRGRRMQAGVSLSSALDPPGRLSTLVHTSTVNSLLWASMPLWASALPPPPPSCLLLLLAASCRVRGLGRRDTVASLLSPSQPPVSSPGSSFLILLSRLPFKSIRGGQEIRHTVHKVNTIRPVC